MFRAWCAAEGREVLLTTRRITALRLTAEASEIDFTCWCGHEATIRDPRPGVPAPAATSPAAA